MRAHNTIALSSTRAVRARIKYNDVCWVLAQTLRKGWEQNIKSDLSYACRHTKRSAASFARMRPGPETEASDFDPGKHRDGPAPRKMYKTCRSRSTH